MKDTLSEGVDKTVRVVVDDPRTTGLLGGTSRVYATPALIADMEIACRELLLIHLDDDEDSVGIRVDIDHLAPTLLGMEVEIHVTVVEIRRRIVAFEFTARDTVEEVAHGRHERFIVDVAETVHRLADKRARAAGQAAATDGN